MDLIRQKIERRFWDRFACFYDLFMKKTKRLYGEITKLIQQELGPDCEVLDLAAGTGLLALELASKVKKVSGMDISSEMINLARIKAKSRQIGNVEFSTGDAYQLPFTDNSFDVVLISNALHVMLQPELVLAEAHRVLKQDGRLIVPTFCHGENYLSRLVSMLMSLVGFKAYHRWSVNDFKGFIAANRFSVVRFEILKDFIPLAFLVARKG